MRLLLAAMLISLSLHAEEFIRFDLSLVKPFGGKMQYASIPQTPQISYDRSFTNLARIYASRKVEFEHLKAVTLAMMMLESGRGSSMLAKQFNNFGGLKYRPEMSTYANKIKYRASDGVDYYCKFDSIEDFIDGFWAFLDRKPYEGWRKNARSEREFLEFIAPIYCPLNAEYTASVMRLLPEAKALLMQNAQDSYRVALSK
jgi:N-acetylmuramoyl-L-alanine amidase